MRSLTLALLVGLITIGLFCCAVDKPTAIDGTLALQLVVLDTSGTISPGQVAPVPRAQLFILSTEYNILISEETDDQGWFDINHLLGARYQIAAYKYFIRSSPNDPPGLLLTGTLMKDFSRKTTHRDLDTLRVGPMPPTGLVINEIYYTGPANSNNYFSDQYIELYNASSQTVYLDKLFLCRISDEKNQDNHIVAIEYYQFPGTGTDFPVLPQQFVVIAQDAMDHINERGIPTSIDLSNADWEFYNIFANDVDNPKVPNLENRSPTKIGEDFIINLANDELALIRIDGTEPVQYFEQNGKQTPYRIFRVDQVIDGVEYSIDPDLEPKKAFDIRIDAGYAGVGIERYSGHSIERHHPMTGGPGFDSNNSSFDFKALHRPTPGRQHVTEEIYVPQKTLALMHAFERRRKCR